MTSFTLYFATNRNHIDDDRWHPESYGKEFSNDGGDNLRFGRMTVRADDARIEGCQNRYVKDRGNGDGTGWLPYCAECMKSGSIEAFLENIENNIPELHQDKTQFNYYF